VVFERVFGGLPRIVLGCKRYSWKVYDVFYIMESSRIANDFSKPLKN
jgi:hypothetical protein